MIEHLLPGRDGTSPSDHPDGAVEPWLVACRPGLTLIELMIVTAILSILAMAAAGPIMNARERTMIAAARAEVASIVKTAEMYRAVNDVLPVSITDLAEWGHVTSRDIVVCVFEMTDHDWPAEDELRVDVRHRGSRTGVTTTHPTDNGVATELDLDGCHAAVEPDEEAAGPEPEPPPAAGPPNRGGGEPPGGNRGNRGS